MPPERGRLPGCGGETSEVLFLDLGKDGPREVTYTVRVEPAVTAEFNDRPPGTCVRNRVTVCLLPGEAHEEIVPVGSDSSRPAVSMVYYQGSSHGVVTPLRTSRRPCAKQASK